MNRLPSRKRFASIKDDSLQTTALYYGAFVLLGISVALFGPSLPYLAEHTHSRLAEVSYLFVTNSIGYLLGSFLIGSRYDRYRGHLLMALGAMVMTVALIVVPVIPWLAALTVGVFVLGLAQSTMDVGANTLLVWVHGEKTGPFMSGLHFFYGIGTFIAPILLAWILERTGDIHWAYWALCVIILPMAWLLVRQNSPMHPSLHTDQEIRPPVPLLLGLLVLLFFLMVGAEASYGNWIYTYTLTIDGGTETVAAYVNSAFWGGFMVGRLAGVPLSSKFRASVLLFADITGSILGLVIVLLFPASMTALWIGSILVGASLASMFPLGMSLANHWMTITGTVNRWFFVGSSLGAMVFPWSIGQWIETSGPQVVIAAILGAMLAAFLVYSGLIWSAGKKKKRLEQFDISK